MDGSAVGAVAHLERDVVAVDFAVGKGSGHIAAAEKAAGAGALDGSSEIVAGLAKREQ